MAEKSLADLFKPFQEWLAWLDSPDGLTHRQKTGGEGNDFDIAMLIPTPPGRTIYTIGDLRALIQKVTAAG